MRAMRFAAGVNTSSGLGAGGPIRPATVNPSADEPVYVTSVTSYVATFLRKNVFFRGLGPFLVLLAAVTTSCIVRSSSEAIRRSNAALNEHVLLASDFAGVRNANEFYVVTEKILRQAYRSRQRSHIGVNSGQRAVAVGVFAIRQFRTAGRAIDDLPAFGGRPYLPGEALNASKEYGTEAVFWFSYPAAKNLIDDIIVDPTNASNVYLPNSLRPSAELFHGTRLELGGRVYPAAGKQFQLGPWAYSEVAEDEAVAQLRRSRDSSVWVYFNTKALFVDTLWFSTLDGYFFYGTNSIEVLGSGAVITNTRSYPFRPLNIRDRRHPSFGAAVVAAVADAFMFVGAVLLAANVVARTLVERRLAPAGGASAIQYMRLWVVYDVLLLSLITAVLVYHAILFTLCARTLDQSPGTPVSQQATSSMSALVRIASNTELSDTLKGWLFIAIWLRIFGFLQYVPRLAIVTETVRAAANDLAAAAVIFMVLIAAFSLAGAVLFSENSDDFSTTLRSFDFLSQIVGTGEVPGFDGYTELSPMASSYFIVFLFIVIAILLNAVIGILASSFVYAAESFNLVRLSDWKPTAVVRAVVTLAVRMRRSPHERRRDDAYVRVYQALDAARLSACGYAGELRTASDAVGEQSANSTTFSGGGGDPEDVVLTLRQLRRLTANALGADAVVEEIFRKAQEQRGTANGKTRYLRVFGRQRTRESDMERDVGAQTALLAQVQKQLFGGAAKDDGALAEPDEGGDDPLLDRVAQAAAQVDQNDPQQAAAQAAKDAARRPLHGFRSILDALTAQQAAISRRVGFDHRLATASGAAAADRRREVAEALEAVQRRNANENVQS